LNARGVKWLFGCLAILAFVGFSAPAVQLVDSTGTTLTLVNGQLPITAPSALPVTNAPTTNATLASATTANAIATGPGYLSSIVVTTVGTTGTVTCYDGLTATGTVIGGLTANNGTTLLYTQNVNAAFSTGLSCVSATAGPAVTIGYRP
jgi:hypothetical protein